MQTIVYIFVLLALAACGQQQPAAVAQPATPQDFPTVLVAAGPDGAKMQEFSTMRACSEASVVLESSGRIVTKCVPR